MASNAHKNIASRYPRNALLLRILISLSIIFLIIGLLAPIFTISKLIVIQNTFSIIDGIGKLIEEQQWFLFVIITTFSIVLPIIKIIILSLLVSHKVESSLKNKKYLAWIHQIGKWSMLDVFVIAILIVSVKLGPLVDIEMEFGLYAFAISVILVMIITSQIVRLTDV
ncbi:MAG: paraquat-inducible protein A [Gammaproteobacteria bacterium]